METAGLDVLDGVGWRSHNLVGGLRRCHARFALLAEGEVILFGVVVVAVVVGVGGAGTSKLLLPPEV